MQEKTAKFSNTDPWQHAHKNIDYDFIQILTIKGITATFTLDLDSYEDCRFNNFFF